MRLSYLLTAAVLLIGPSAALAQDDAGPHGGQVVEIKGHFVELTVNDKEIVIYLTDEKGGPIDSKGTSGRVVILDGEKQTSAALTPVDPNLLSAKLEAGPPAGAKVVLSAKLSDGHELQARFVTK